MANNFTDKEITEYRKLFPVVNDFIYLDHAGVAPISTRVKSKVNDFLDIALNKGATKYDCFMEEVENVRTNFSRLLNCKQQEIAFIKNTSHGLSLIAKGIEWRKGDSIIVFEKEFPANL